MLVPNSLFEMCCNYRWTLFHFSITRIKDIIFVFRLLWVIWGHLEVNWRSFGGSKLNSNNRNRLSSPENLGKDILHAPKWDLVRFLFLGHYRSFEVIWRSFGGSKLNSNERNRLSIPKNLRKDILHAPKWDLVKELCFQVIVGHLGHLEVILRSFCGSKLNSNKRNRLSIPKNLGKDILHAPKWELVKSYVFRSL